MSEFTSRVAFTHKVIKSDIAHYTIAGPRFWNTTWTALCIEHPMYHELTISHKDISDSGIYQTEAEAEAAYEYWIREHALPGHERMAYPALPESLQQPSAWIPDENLKETLTDILQRYKKKILAARVVSAPSYYLPNNPDDGDLHLLELKKLQPAFSIRLQPKHTKAELAAFLETLNFTCKPSLDYDSIDGTIWLTDGSWITREWDSSELQARVYWQLHERPDIKTLNGDA